MKDEIIARLIMEERQLYFEKCGDTIDRMTSTGPTDEQLLSDALKKVTGKNYTVVLR